jgi:nickel-dependent lactate racemase
VKSKERAVKTYTIKHLDNIVIIESDHMLPDSLKTILSTVFTELRKRRPDKLDRVMQLYQFFYDKTVREEAAKLAKKADRKLPKEDEPELETFEFWRELVETPPGHL